MKLNDMYLRKFVPFLFIGLLVFHAGCGKEASKEPERVNVNDQKALIKSIVLEKEDHTFKLNFSGMVKPFERVDIGFKISGRVDRIFFDEGNDVLKADKLAVLERAELEAAFRQAEASFLKAKSSHDRNKRLLEDGTISPSEIERSEAEFKIKRAAQELSEIQLNNTELFAPITGKVAFRNIEEKEVVLPNKAYFTIMNVNHVIIEIGVPEYQISRLFTGKKATATLEAYPNEKFIGEVHNVAMAADDNNKLFKVEIKVKNDYELLKPGMIALVELQVEEFKDVYSIPLNVMSESEGKKYMFLSLNGTAKKHVLKNYHIHGSKCVLMDKLPEGSRLIVKGYHLLNDGMKVYE